MRSFILVIGLFASVAAVPLHSQDADAPAAPAAEPAPGEQTTSQVPAEGYSGLPERAPQAPTMRAYWHVFIAFAVTWALLFGYALSVGQRFARLEEEVQRLRG